MGQVNTIVAGMGPSGLSSALSLMIKGHNVTLIDKRDDYTLLQKVIIPNKLIQDYLAIGVESDYLEKLIKKNGLTTLKSFQDFQLSVLASLYHDKKIQVNGVTIPITGTLTVFQGSANEIIDVNGQEQTITLKNKKIVPFDHIIDATGKHSHVISLLSKSSNAKYKINYSNDLPQPHHKFNAIVAFKANTDNAQVAILNAATNYTSSEFVSNGWKHEIPPTYYLRAKRLKNSVYVLTEIPEQLANEKNPNKVIEFIKPILQKECNINVNALKVQRNDIQLFSAFDIKHKIADKPYVQLGKKGYAIVVGDARMPANFHFGHGVSKGIEDGLNLMDAFNAKGKCIPHVLEMRCKNIRNEVLFYQNDHERMVDYKYFFKLRIFSKIRFILKELFNRDFISLTSKSVLLSGPLFLFSMPLGITVGLAIFSYMKWYHFYANFTYSIPRKKNPVSTDTQQNGRDAQLSWKGYLRSFCYKQNYTHYFDFVEGQIEARKNIKLGRVRP